MSVARLKKRVLINFTKFTVKHLCQRVGPATSLKKRLWHRCFPENRTQKTFLTEHLWMTASGETLVVNRLTVSFKVKVRIVSTCHYKY